MATYDSAYLLAQFDRYAGRPATDAITPTTKYQWLAEAQNQIIADIASRAPEVLYGAPVLMTSSDGGFTFDFGTDANGYPLFPFGKVGIYTDLNAIPSISWNEGLDYLGEGTRIRIPNNRTYAGALYWRGITPPADLSATTQPALLPEAARELITITAVKNFAQAGNINPDLAAQMAEQWGRAFARWMLVFRTQFRNGGALSPLVGGLRDSAYPYSAYLPGV